MIYWHQCQRRFPVKTLLIVFFVTLNFQVKAEGKKMKCKNLEGNFQFSLEVKEDTAFFSAPEVDLIGMPFFLNKEMSDNFTTTYINEDLLEGININNSTISAGMCREDELEGAFYYLDSNLKVSNSDPICCK